jgi:diadenosine tetraphosphatase ApaH/serine/threonine PP2A family protein phosphatase
VEGVRFVNAGSVGRPKDGDPRACWLLLDVDVGDGEEGRGTGGGRLAVEWVRVPYDLERAARGIRDSGLPDDFADYLASGGTLTRSRPGST